MQLPTALMGERTYVNVTCKEDGDRIVIKFPFNRTLLKEIKAFEGSRWHPEDKTWSIKDSQRNRFQLAFLAGWNPYAPYDKPLVEFIPNRSKLFAHQVDLTQHIITYRQVLLAAEMGTGKTLSIIEAMEWVRTRIGWDDWIYVGPKSALASVSLEFRKWGTTIRPKFLTYDGLKKLIETWKSGEAAPHGVVFDESSRIKTPTAQRSVAALHLANSIREEYGNDGFVVLMSGSPAPKSPADWWFQCEVAQPGYIREGTPDKFKARLGLIVQKENGITGGTYPHLITWLDDERKCAKCGQFREDPIHDLALMVDSDVHAWEKSKNEVSYLYERMNGLVIVKFKKDCMDLPEKQYREIQCRPSQEALNGAKLVLASATTTISGLTLLRELSDGFQYHEEIVGQETCSRCQGGKTITRLAPIKDDLCDECGEKEDHPSHQDGEGLEHFYQPPQPGIPGVQEANVRPWQEYEEEIAACPVCSGRGQVNRVNRKTIMVPCPKEDVLLDILDSHDDDGRLVTYGGFTGSVDRICSILQKAKWQYIRVDGRGWDTSCINLRGRKPEDMLEAFQDPKKEIERLCFVGQPSAAGMGLTLTAACELVYYSNDFNAESRIQSEDRIHRAGMDVNRGALITDILHLPTDKTVLDNLKKKRKLQDMSLGEYRDAMKHLSLDGERRV